jgi:adenylate cyclase
MRDALDDVNRDQRAHGLPDIRAGFGVATGEVVAGNVGSERKVEYTVIGDAVNLASRLQELSRDLGEPILVDAETAAGARQDVRLEDIGSQQIRGRAEPVEVYAARDLLHSPAVAAPAVEV